MIDFQRLPLTPSWYSILSFLSHHDWTKKVSLLKLSDLQAWCRACQLLLFLPPINAVCENIFISRSNPRSCVEQLFTSFNWSTFCVHQTNNNHTLNDLTIELCRCLDQRVKARLGICLKCKLIKSLASFKYQLENFYLEPVLRGENTNQEWWLIWSQLPNHFLLSSSKLCRFSPGTHSSESAAKIFFMFYQPTDVC